jgi:hypothetical protein
VEANASRAATTAVRLVAIGDFDQPLYVSAPPGDAGRVFVLERGGDVRLVRAGASWTGPS